MKQSDLWKGLHEGLLCDQPPTVSLKNLTAVSQNLDALLFV